MNEEKDIYLITGEDDFLREYELKEIINRFSAKTAELFTPLEKTTESSPIQETPLRGFRVETFYAEDSDVVEILSSATTYSFSNRKKIIVIKNVEKFNANQKNHLFNFLTRQKNPFCFFILIIKDKTQALKFHSQHKDKSELIYCEPLYGTKLSRWIHERTKEKNIRILPEAIELLKEKLGNNLWAINNVLEQLSIYAKDYLEITPSLIKKLIGKSIRYSAFDLVDKIASRNLKACLEIYQTLLNEKIDFTEIVGVLSWQLRRLWQAKQLIVESKDRNEVGKILNIRYFKNRFFLCLKNFNMCDLENAIRELAKIDLEIKTGGKKPPEALQIFIVKLCRR